MGGWIEERTPSPHNIVLFRDTLFLQNSLLSYTEQHWMKSGLLLRQGQLVEEAHNRLVSRSMDPLNYSSATYLPIELVSVVLFITFFLPMSNRRGDSPHWMVNGICNKEDSSIIIIFLASKYRWNIIINYFCFLWWWWIFPVIYISTMRERVSKTFF